MNYTLTELLWLLIIYSFLGWTIETIVGTLKKKKFVNRDFSTGPFCLVYGSAAITIALSLEELADSPLFLFLGSAALATLIEWITGKVLERLNRHKWWDYSGKKWNFDGYICLQYSIVWGILGSLTVKIGNRNLLFLFRLIPTFPRDLFVGVFTIAILLDLLASLAVIFHLKRQMPTAILWKKKIAVWTQRLGLAMVSHVERRISKAYPVIFEASDQIKKEGKFAEGCGFYKLFWLFLVGSLLGDFTETIFCRLTTGTWMSRTSLVWGPFSIVWGFAIAIATALLYKDKEKPDSHIFFVGTFLGGAYEYLCSVLSELVFGKVFWDYSEIPFNLGGRINLLYCFFWGIAAVVWIKVLYPKVAGLIEKLPLLWGYVLTWLLVIFMVVNMAVSVLALIRYDMRGNGKPPANALERLLDDRFDDQRMKRTYPNAKEAG